MFKAFFLACSVATISLSTHAAAQDDTSGAVNQDKQGAWVSRPYTIIYTGNALSAANQGMKVTGEVMITDNTPRAGNVVFACINNTFAITTSTEPVDFKAFMKENRKGRKKQIIGPKVFIAGKQIKTRGWIHVKDTKVMLAGGESTRRKIYNAAIRGDSVRIEFKKFDFNLNLPKPNADFAEFGGACGLGNNKDAEQAEGEFVSVRGRR